MILLLISALFLHCASSEGQNPFRGQFRGTVEGDPVVLTLEPAGNGKMIGKMQDSQQAYEVQADVEGNAISGTATEQTYGLVLAFQGTLSGDRLPLTMEIQGMGAAGTFLVELQREGSSNTTTSQPQAGTKETPPSGSTKKEHHQLDPQVTGTWVHEEIYNSGYGDNFMGGAISSEITFSADGRLIEGAGSATMSGSNYYGESGDQGSGEMEGIRWYTRNQEIWLIVSRDGQTQEVKLGRYGFGGGAMRITTDNGEKLLLIRK